MEIYISEADLELLNEIKKITGYQKPGKAIIAALYGYKRSLITIQRLTKDKINLSRELESIKENNLNK